MATIEQVVLAGDLVPYELPDWESRNAIRPLWLPPSFFDWADGKAELHDAARRFGGRTIYEHMLIMLDEFCCAPRIGAGDLKRVMPTKNGVWKLHPPGLRLYGWAPATSALVLVTGALESETKADGRLNEQKRKEVVAFIKNHQLAQTVVRGDVRAVFPKIDL